MPNCPHWSGFWTANERPGMSVRQSPGKGPGGKGNVTPAGAHDFRTFPRTRNPIYPLPPRARMCPLSGALFFERRAPPHIASKKIEVKLKKSEFLCYNTTQAFGWPPNE